MAKYRVIYWKHIPLGVIASENGEQARASLPKRFQVAVDAYAMSEELTDDGSYSAGFRKGSWEEREGSPQEVAEAVAAELEAAHPTINVRRRKKSK